ncbi:hypothetical protein BST61_g597 [Cercospora zeina]
MREDYGNDDDAACIASNAVTKRTKVYGNKKRLITSTSNAAECATREKPASRVQQTQEALPARGLYSASVSHPRPIRYIPTYPKIHRDHLDVATLQTILSIMLFSVKWTPGKPRSCSSIPAVCELVEAGEVRTMHDPEVPSVFMSRSHSRDPLVERYGPETETIHVDPEGNRREKESEEELERIRAESDRIKREMKMEREEKEKVLREERLREYERHAHGAREFDEDEDDSMNDSSSDVSGPEFVLDVNFLPSIKTDDSMDLDTLSTGSSNGLLAHGHHRGEAQRYGPMQERYISSTKWHGSTFDETEFGAEIQVLSTPPAKKAQPPMLHWTHLERAMPSFEEFESAVQKTTVAPSKQKRHVNNLLRKLQRNNEQQRQQGREMKAFCEADVDIEERGGEIQQTSSVCALSIPFFSLEQSLVAQIDALSSGSPEHPPRPLLQTHSRMLNESRERAQAVTTLSSTPQGHYLHVSHLWCVIVNDDTLITCSRLPLKQVAKDLKIVNGSQEKHSPNGVDLRIGDSRKWRFPADIVSSAPRFLSLLTESVLDLMKSNATLKYRGKPVDFSNWASLLDDSSKSGAELFVQRAYPSYHRIKKFEALSRPKNIMKLQNWLHGSGIDAAGASPAGRHESQSPKFWQDVRNMRLYLLSTQGSLEALKDLATGMHQSLSSAKHKVARNSYLSCGEASPEEIQGWLKLHETSGTEDKAKPVSKRERTIKQHRLIIANLSQGLFGFFWPMDFDHVLARKFWGALKVLLYGEVFYGNGIKDRKKDVEMMQGFFHDLCDRVFDFILPFATAFSHCETDLSTLPEQFYRAWLHIISAFTIAAKAKLGKDHDSNWSEPHERFRSAQEALEEGERALVLRMRRDDIEDFEICSSRGIVSLMLDCVTRDLMNGKADVAQTYSDYSRRLEAKMVADPLTRSHQETLRGLQQELEAVTTILHQQLDVLNSFESSIRDLDCNSRTPDLPLIGDSRQDLVLRQCKAHISSRLDRFEALQGRANELGEWHLSEIHINKDRQEAAILVFTIVTIIFLPLSFVSSVFGMNTVDIRDMAQGQWAYWAAAAPLTIIVVGVSLWFAGAFDNASSWFARSAKSTPAGYQQLPEPATSRIEKLEPRNFQDQKPLIFEPRRRTTYPTKHSYA